MLFVNVKCPTVSAVQAQTMQMYLLDLLLYFFDAKNETYSLHVIT